MVRSRPGCPLIGVSWFLRRICLLRDSSGGTTISHLSCTVLVHLLSLFWIVPNLSSGSDDGFGPLSGLEGVVPMERPLFLQRFEVEGVSGLHCHSRLYPLRGVMTAYQWPRVVFQGHV